VNPNAKYFLAVLSAVAVGAQVAFPHAAWTPGLVSAITAALGALHLVPAVAASSPTESGNGT